MISKCNNPKKPHLNPIPKIDDFCNSYSSEESFRVNLAKDVLRLSKFSVSVG